MLVLDDEILLIMILEEWLLDFGCLVIGPAFSTPEALALLATRAIDVALLDVQLGSETSLPVAEDLQRRGIPFAFVTGYVDRVGALESFAGAPRVSKPAEKHEIHALLKLLSRQVS